MEAVQKTNRTLDETRVKMSEVLQKAVERGSTLNELEKRADYLEITSSFFLDDTLPWYRRWFRCNTRYIPFYYCCTRRWSHK